MMLRLVLDDGTPHRQTILARKAQSAGELYGRLLNHLDANAGRYNGIMVDSIRAEQSDDNGLTWREVFTTTDKTRRIIEAYERKMGAEMRAAEAAEAAKNKACAGTE